LSSPLLTLRFKSTNCYLIDTGNGLFAFDAGWPDTYREYRDCLREKGYQIRDIRWFVVSHFHMDHAGLAGLFQEKGAEFRVFSNQLYGLDEMETLLSRKRIPFTPVNRLKMVRMVFSDSRNWLNSIGIKGEILHTNGHDEQSLSLILDTGEALIGDLAPEDMADAEDLNTAASWQLLRSKSARIIYPAHMIEYPLK
jgi:glyoxylase-like metal-dependent hydrolase (beta-lactamase superfamily II)